MASGKRASMREGPLAALFRATDEEGAEQAPAKETAREPVERETREPAPERTEFPDRSQSGASTPAGREPRPGASPSRVAPGARGPPVAALRGRAHARGAAAHGVQHGHPGEHHGAARRAPDRDRPGAHPPGRVAAAPRADPACDRRGRCRRERRGPHDRGTGPGRGVHRREHRRPVAGAVQRADAGAHRQRRDARPRCRRGARDRPARGAGAVRRAQGPAQGRGHGVHHRRRRRRHGNGRGTCGGAHLPRGRRADGGHRDQAVRLRGRAARPAGRAGRGGDGRRGRHPHHDPERPPAVGAGQEDIDGRRLPGGRRRPAPGCAGHLGPDRPAGTDQPGLRRRAHDHDPGRQRAAGHRHGHRREPGAGCRFPRGRVAAAGDLGRRRAVHPAVHHGRQGPVAVRGQRRGQGRCRGRPPRRQHHLRRHGGREAGRRGVDHGRGHRLRRQAHAAPRARAVGLGDRCRPRAPRHPQRSSARAGQRAARRPGRAGVHTRAGGAAGGCDGAS